MPASSFVKHERLVTGFITLSSKADTCCDKLFDELKVEKPVSPADKQGNESNANEKDARARLNLRVRVNDIIL